MRGTKRTGAKAACQVLLSHMDQGKQYELNWPSFSLWFCLSSHQSCCVLVDNVCKGNHWHLLVAERGAGKAHHSTACAHITGVHCCVDHYLLSGQWSSHQDDSTWTLREIANTAKSLETKLQAGQEKQSLLSQSWNPANLAQRLSLDSNNTLFQGYITNNQNI